MFESLLERIL